MAMNIIKKRIPWNKGLTYKCPKISMALKGREVWNNGKPWSNDIKEKISKALKGKKAWNKGKKLHYPVWNKNMKGKYHLPKRGITNRIEKSCPICKKTFIQNYISEDRKFCSQKCCKKTMIGNKHSPDIKGENNPSWNGGRSLEPYPYYFTKQIKDRVRVRDNFRCQLCYLPELECRKPNSHCVHHIDYNKENCNLDNLLLLCHKCHSYTNFNRVFWTRWFRENWHRETLEFIGSHLFQRDLDKQKTLKQGKENR